MDILLYFSLFLLISLLHLPPLPLPLLASPITSRISVVGTVYCDTCLANAFSAHSYYLPGVDVNVECKFNANAPKTTEMISVAVNRSTDNNGVYNLEIPSVDGVDCIDGPPIQSFCQATLIGSSFTACNVPALKLTTDGISVKSRQRNTCVYSFTPLSFRPRKKNGTLCGKQAAALSDPRT